ncbi:MAG: phosphate signaling complex protein PhoU [Bacillota bacterium]|nr:phosphate signaling complex protein PhoU [Bacillota bacterium]
MTRHSFDNHLQILHNDLLRMGSIVEKQIFLSMKALVDQKMDVAGQVIDNDDLVDDLQKEVEDKCIKLIAMEQPLAIDLRNIFTSIKIATDLERIADHAVDIAKISIILKDEVYFKQLIDIPKMFDIVKTMVKESLDSYVEENVEEAYNICKRDDEIDSLYKSIFNELLQGMVRDSSTIKQASQLLFVCKYLERIADHCTNICEDTIYLVTGEQKDLNE